MNPEVPTNGQLDKLFPQFSSVLELMLAGVQIPRCPARLSCSPQNINVRIPSCNFFAHMNIESSPNAAPTRLMAKFRMQ
jgi:hypothetical protein